MTTMKAVRIHTFGGPDVLHYEDVERPEPQTGEVLVRVHAAGINPIDTSSRQFPVPITSGTKPLPYTLGWDISGEVVASGKGVTQFKVGDAVYGMIRFPDEAKAYGEYTTAPITDIALKPQTLTHQEAAGAGLSALTAWQALFDIANLQAGQTILILGGAGGVGHFALQLAKWRGAKVVTTTSTRNVEFVRDLGADIVIDYTREDLVEKIKNTEQVKNFDIVLDTVGGEDFQRAFQIIKPGGQVVTLTAHKGSKDVGEQLAPRYGVTLSAVMVHPSGEQIAEMAKLFDASHLKTHLDGNFPLKDAARAHELSEGGHVRGKLVLTIA